MNVPTDTVVALDITKIVLIMGLVWGLAKMKTSLDMLVKSFNEFKGDFRRMGEQLDETINRVGILEERTSPRRRRTDQGQ